jgi:hypothetical protein
MNHAHVAEKENVVPITFFAHVDERRELTAPSTMKNGLTRAR